MQLLFTMGFPRGPEPHPDPKGTTLDPSLFAVPFRLRLCAVLGRNMSLQSEPKCDQSVSQIDLRTTFCFCNHCYTPQTSKITFAGRLVPGISSISCVFYQSKSLSPFSKPEFVQSFVGFTFRPHRPPKSCHFDHFGDPRSIQTLSRNQPCLVFHFWLILGLILPPSGAPKCVPDAISPCGRPGWPRGVPKSSRAWF